MISSKDYILSIGSESILFAHKVDLLIEDDEIDQALELCEEGVKRFPFYTEGYVQLARCYQLKNRNEDAIKAYKHALILQPSHTKALKGLAYLYYKMRERELGEKTLLKAYLFDPYDAELHEFLESEGLLSKLYSLLVFEEDEKDATRQEDVMLDLEEILDDTRPTDEDERNQILEEIDEHSQVGEKELFGESLDREEEIEKIDESFFDVETSDSEEEDSFPEELAAIAPGIGEQEESKSETEPEPPAEPQEKTTPAPEEREEFTQWMSDLFKPDEPSSPPEEEQAPSEQEPPVADADEQMVNDLDTILIFSDHRKNELTTEPQDEDEDEKPLGDFNALEEDIERISSTEFLEIEQHMVEPESSAEEVAEDQEEQAVVEDAEKKEEAPAEPQEAASTEAEQKSESDVDQVLKRLEESEKRRDESALRKKQIDQWESQAESDNVDIDDIISNPSLLTPTFGEILIAQHKFEDALKVFQALAEKEPENPRIHKKIEFLKKLVVAKK